MSYLTIEKLNQIVSNKLNENLNRYEIFIESGTFYGNTIFSMEPYFKNLHTIEISEKYFLEFEKQKNIHGKFKIDNHLGDTVNILPKILQFLPKDNNCIFWLDGHWSSGDTGKGNKDCPVLDECRIIDCMYKSKEGIILIDDFRLFGTKMNEDWIDITEGNVQKSFKNFDIANQFIFDDILCLKIQK